MRHKIIYLILLLGLPLMMWAENASNVRVRQRNKDIIITYDLSKKSNVQVLMANDKMPDFVPLHAVEGAVGDRVHAGKDLEIIWHPLKENDDFVAQNVRFKVVALGTYEHYLLPRSRGGMPQGGKTNMESFITAGIVYDFTPQMSYSLTFGQTYKGIGWYVHAHTNLNFAKATDGLVCERGGYIDDVLPFYSGRKQGSSLAGTVGAVVDVIELAGESPKNRFNTFGLYAGVGYGWRRVLWETNDHKWVEYGPTSDTGLCGEVGFIGSIYGFTVKVGAMTIGFKNLGIEAGIGWMF